MSAADDALDVARFCWPERAPRVGPALRASDSYRWRFDPDDRDHVAAAERVLVERGLGERYGEELISEFDGLRPDKQTLEMMLAIVRTAPLEVCLRALARVVREKQPKEVKP